MRNSQVQDMAMKHPRAMKRDPGPSVLSKYLTLSFAFGAAAVPPPKKREGSREHIVEEEEE